MFNFGIRHVFQIQNACSVMFENNLQSCFRRLYRHGVWFYDAIPFSRQLTLDEAAAS